MGDEGIGGKFASFDGDGLDIKELLR